MAVEVAEGVVTLRGRVPDIARVPAAAGLARSVAGVVDVECELFGRTSRRSAAGPEDPGPGR